MIPLRLGDIATITGGELVDGAEPDTIVSGPVEFDSRNVSEGSLFVCLPGARVDGHDFAGIAVEQGAVACLEGHRTGQPGILVDNSDTAELSDSASSYVLEADTTGEGQAVITALSKLARAHTKIAVSEHGLTVIGVTGSAGKTSTKDLIASVLRQAGETVAPPGSFNNELGHPYTALKVGEHTTYLVSELSARSIGNIAHLARIAPPRIGAVLNVGTAHIGEFGSKENIARAKGELVEALPAADDGGVAVLNADDPLVIGMRDRTTARIVTFGVTNPADVRAEDVELDAVARPAFTLTIAGEKPRRIQLRVFGRHQVYNALAAAAVGHAAGLDCESIADALSEHVSSSEYRMDVRTRADGVTVINDSYNANPDSMRAGIDALAFTASGRENCHSWAVLGCMGELGDDSLSEHAALAEVLYNRHIDNLVAVGDNTAMGALALESRRYGVNTEVVSTTEEAADIVLRHLKPGDVVLVKASNLCGLWAVAHTLLASPGDPGAENVSDNSSSNSREVK